MLWRGLLGHVRPPAGRSSLLQELDAGGAEKKGIGAEAWRFALPISLEVPQPSGGLTVPHRGNTLCLHALARLVRTSVPLFGIDSPSPRLYHLSVASRIILSSPANGCIGCTADSRCL